MARRILSYLIIAAMALGGHAEESVGLVLSGGGAKGIAHMGFIQALEEAEIPIDCISGTSMGAIVGSLYASGLSPQQMLALIKSKEFQLWSTGQTPTSEKFDFVAPQPSSRWVGVNLALADSLSTDFIPTRLINPLPMSYAFMQLYAPATGACGTDFNRLMVPLRTVASDIWTHRPVVFSHGELSVAVRASMSFPFVFQPIEVNGNVLYDGGLYDVYPVDVMMQEFNPDRVIGVNLSSPNTKPTLNNLIDQMECMIMNDVDYPFPTDRGVNIRFNLERYGLLDWGQADTIYNYGYQRGRELIDSIRAKVSARRPLAEVEHARSEFRKRLVDVKFDTVEVSGTTPQKSQYIQYLMTAHPRRRGMLDMDDVRSGFYRVASTGRMRNFVPHANLDTATGRWTLELNADVDRDYKLGAGGYLTSSAGSMLYAMASYDPFALRRPAWSFEAWAGLNYMAAYASSHINIATAIPSRLILRTAIASERMYESQKMFYDFRAPAFVKNLSFYVKGGWEMAAGRHGLLSVSAGYARLESCYHIANPDNPAMNGESRLRQDLGVATVSWSRNTLNTPYLATSGSRYEASASLLGGKRHLHPWGLQGSNPNAVWVDIKASALQYFNLSRRFAVGLGAEGYWSTRPLLSTYTSSMVTAGAFAPLPSDYYLFDTGFRANQWLAGGIHPVFDISRLLQVRADAFLYLPLRRIENSADLTARYGRWIGTPRFMGEVSLALNLPFGVVRAYLDYRNGNASKWGGGISFGLLLRAPGATD